MSNWRKIAFSLLLVFLLFEIIVIFPGRLEKNDNIEEQQKKLSKLSGTPEQVMKQINLVEAQHGHRDWELFAEVAEGTQEKAMWELKKVRVLFYTNEGVVYTVTGNRGQIDGKSKNMTIEGDVVTKSANGYEYRAEQVYYLAAERKIRTPGALSMIGPKDSQGQGLLLTGTRMTILVDNSKMLIDSEVRASKVLSDQRTLKIESDSAEFNGVDNEAKFLGRVKLSYDKMEIRGPLAIFSYKKGTNLLDSILMKGGIQAVDQQKFATAENMTVDVLTQKMVFRGQPRLVQNNDELNGEEIIFLEGGKKVKVEKVKVNANESPRN
jgi:LPS export ABC transporter protein LptC